MYIGKEPSDTKKKILKGYKNPPIKLHTKCYKALYLNALYPPRTYEPFGDFQDVSQELPLTLEPYGCTNLRLTYFHKTKTRKN